MKPKEQIEEIYSKIAMVASFYVLVHDSKDMYLVVEKKHIPENVLVIESPVFRFMHESLVIGLETCGAKFRKKQQVKIVNKSLNEERNDYLIAESEIKVKFKEIQKPSYVPSAINELEETGAIFFSKEVINRLTHMGLKFEELPAFPNIIPVGSA